MQISGAQAIIQCLLEQGVDTVFGYPGGQILPLYDALYDAPLRHVITVHEQGAAHAADGYARASGKVGVCIATSGPGATNLITGLAAAFMDSIPLVAITGQVPTSLIGRDSFQEVDITGMTMPITKHNFQVKDPKKLVDVLRLSFRIARSGRPGPVLIDIPRDIQVAQVEFVPMAEEEKTKWQPTATTEKLLEEAAKVLAAAKRPVMIVGGGAIHAQVHEEVHRLAEKCSLPVISTLMGLGAMAGDHPNFLGLTGMHGNKIANHAVHNGDVLIAVGSRFSDRMTGTRTVYTKGKTLIQLDVDPAEINKNVDAHIGLSGDVKTLMGLLLEWVNSRENPQWWETIQSWKTQFTETFDGEPLSVPWVMQEIARQTKDGSYIFTADVGQHQMWAAQHLVIPGPRSWVSSGGLGSMGFALPASIGAQMAQPKKRVVHLCGDGGFQMTGMELYTVATQKLPIISVIINNRRLGMIKQLQHVYFDQRYCQCAMPYPVDFTAFAGAFGVEAAEANTPREFTELFQAACQSDTAKVLVVNVREEEYVTPMLKAGASLIDYVEF